MNGDTIKSYRDLIVWQEARQLVKRVHQITRQFPQEELYCLTKELKRTAISVPSNIAEGHSRRGIKDYISFVSIAIGSLAELDTQMVLAYDFGYIDETTEQSFYADVTKLQRQLHALRNSLKKRLHEQQSNTQQLEPETT